MTGMSPLLSQQGYQPYQGPMPFQMSGNYAGMTGMGSMSSIGAQGFDSFSGMMGSGMPSMSGMMGGNMMGSMGSPAISGSTLQLMTQLNSMMASVMQNLMGFVQTLMQSVMQRQQTQQTTGTTTDGTNGTSGTTSPKETTGTKETSGTTETAGSSTPKMKELAAKAEKVAKNMGSTGRCLAGVRQALEDSGCGNTTRRMSAYQKAEDFANSDKYKEIKVGSASDLKNLPAGAIVVWNKKSGHPHGHISVALGDGREASDHIQKQITNYGSSFRVFLPQ